MELLPPPHFAHDVRRVALDVLGLAISIREVIGEVRDDRWLERIDMPVSGKRLDVGESKRFSAIEVRAEAVDSDGRGGLWRRQVREQRQEGRHARIFFRWLVRAPPQQNSIGG